MTGPVRVLVFLRRTDPQVYGGTRSMLTFLERQRSLDPLAVVCAARPEDPSIGELERIGVRHRLMVLPKQLEGFRARPASEKLRRLRGIAGHNRELARVIRGFDADLVTVDAEAFHLAGPAAKLAGRPLVQHVRGVQSTRAVRWFRQLALALADANVGISDSLCAFHVDGCHPLLRRRVGRRLARVHVAVAGAAIRRYADRVPAAEARRALGIAPDELAIGLFGGIFPVKRQAWFFEAIAPRVAERRPEARFHVVGGVKDARYHDAVLAAVRRSGLEPRVRFAGYRRDIFRWHRAIDVLAHPSRTEGVGRVAVEAQAFGTPVVAADTVGLRDAVRDGVGGFLAADADAFAERLLQLAGDAGLREALGRRGRDDARRFEADAVTRELEAVYAAVANGRSPVEAAAAARTREATREG